MELGAHVWLRKEDSHWGWVPAVISKKEPVTVRGVELINITLNEDRNIEQTMPPPQDGRASPGYFTQEEEFEVVVTVDPEQLKTADHDDIKLRNLPNSFHLQGEDPEAGVITSPSTHSESGVVGGVDDLIGLTHLHEPAILHALRLRYDENIIYTATGPILIAVNPFKRMDIYGGDVMETYCTQGEQTSAGSNTSFITPFKNRRVRGEKSKIQQKRLAPHVYQTADDAYRAMMRGMENTDLMKNPKTLKRGTSAITTTQRESPTNQSILVSGESGAGKTVTTKIVLNYFAMLSKRRQQMQRSTPTATPTKGSPDKNMQGVSTEQQVLQSNPILEAFGNARTIRNDNSSRFGKYIDIRFNRSGKLSGAQIETYLLEKVRLIHIGAGERNYHVFYQFLAGASDQERRNYLIGNKHLQDFKLLNQSGTYQRRDGVDDAMQHKEMLDAMITIGFGQQEVHDLMRLVVGVLFAGNMSFTPSRDGESCRLNQDEFSLSCAKLLGISFEGLAAALTARVILAGDEIVHKVLNVEEATKAAEALIKSIYGAMFDFIVEKVNAGIDQDVSGNHASIGVLDIFGFETFKTNSFEQLCINFTNEALQQQFNKYVFKLEQQEYEKEGIMWKFISFPDNQDVLDLIDKKHEGILPLLDEQCILPRSTDEKYTRYLYGRCDKHPRFKASSSQRVDHRFSIEHYAGDVEYNTHSWIEKNKDQLPAASSDLLSSSEFDMISAIQRFVRTEERAGRGTVATKSVSSQFSSQLGVLRTRIDKTVPHYIRCLKPNDDLVPDYFEPKNVVEQLRCGGVLEAVRVSRAGYPTRYPHDVFLARYRILGDNNDATPQSPIFSPKSTTEDSLELKRLIAKMAFELWYADHQHMLALIQADSERTSTVHSTFFQAQTKNLSKPKLHSGPYAPPFNLVVESSVMTPDGKHKKNKNTPSLSARNRKKEDGVVRPESEEEFLDLDFPSRCAVAGLQLGRTKVFLRREAFDRIESMRSERFNSAAAAIQKIVRGKMCREYFQLMRYAAVVIQSVLRMRLSQKSIRSLRSDTAVETLQRWWRGCMARIFITEILITRRYAASVIQEAWRSRGRETSDPLDEQKIIRAIVSLQAVARGNQARASNPIPHYDDDEEVEYFSPAPLVQKSFSPLKEQQVAPMSLDARDVITTENDSALGTLLREIQNENWAMVESILDKDPALAEIPDLKTGEMVLHKIARHNGAWTLLVDMVLVLHPQALIHRDNMGALPIHHASAHDNLAALEIIHSAYKEGINETDNMGRLPIHVAATYDAIDAVKFLLAKHPEGAYTMVYRPPAESGGGLPLHIACSNHATIGVITALLAENFASAKRADENGDLPLHLLLRCGEAVDPVVVKTLLQCFTTSVSRTDMFGDLPLAIAIKHQCRAAVINAVLMHYPEGAGVLNGDGHSPLFLAFKHNADDRTIMGLLNHAPELATAIDRKTGLLPIQVATENEHSHFIVHTLLKRDLPVDLSEKVRAQLIPHHFSWNHIVSNTEDLYHQVVTKVLQSCTQPQVLALAHVEGPDGKIALASATPVCKHELRVMLRLFNTLEVVNQRPAYTNPVSDTQIFYALRYDPPPQHNGQFTVLHEEKKDGGNDNDYLEDLDDQSHVSALSRHSLRSTLTSRSQQTIEDRLRHIRKEKGQQVIAKLTSRSEIVERELKVRKEFHLSRHYVPAIISVHHTVQHAAYSEAMAEPGYCITMEGADTTAENLMLDLRRSGKRFPPKALKRIGISLLHLHEHGIVHGDFGTHNIGKFGSRWKLLGVGGCIPIGAETDPSRGFYHPPESIEVEKRRTPIGNSNLVATVESIEAKATYDVWAYGVVVYEAIAGVPLTPYACRGKRAMTVSEVSKIGTWDNLSIRKALKVIPDDEVAQDLLKRVLHYDPKQRTQSMREVLEHPFFTGGSLPQASHDGSKTEQATPNTAGSAPSRTSSSRAAASRPRDPQPPNGARAGRRYRDDPPDNNKVSSSTESSIENRENNVPSVSPSTNSNRSGRSFGAFRKRLTSSRTQKT